MPELPEVETVMRGMERALAGRSVAGIKTARAGLRVPFPPGLGQKLRARAVTGLYRRAKYIVVDFSGGRSLVLHLGMSGRVLLLAAGQDYNARKHDHLVMTFDDNSRLVYNDSRRFGMVLLAATDDINALPSFAALGPEPLGNEFSGAILHAALRRKKTSIKAALMDQRVVAGLGNIYVSEALFHAGIHPARIAATLSVAESENLVRAIRDVLTRAIAAGGSTLRDYRHADGSLGYFQHGFAVYDKQGQCCPRCCADMDKPCAIVKVVQGGRSTFYCPATQR